MRIAACHVPILPTTLIIFDVYYYVLFECAQGATCRGRDATYSKVRRGSPDVEGICGAIESGSNKMLYFWCILECRYPKSIKECEIKNLSDKAGASGAGPRLGALTAPYVSGAASVAITASSLPPS